MGLLTLEYYKNKKMLKDSDLDTRKLESQLLLELKTKLNAELMDADRLLLEVSEKVVGVFLNILSDNILSMYDYEQVDKTKFIFYNKELRLF